MEVSLVWHGQELLTGNVFLSNSLECETIDHSFFTPFSLCFQGKLSQASLHQDIIHRGHHLRDTLPRGHHLRDILHRGHHLVSTHLQHRTCQGKYPPTGGSTVLLCTCTGGTTSRIPCSGAPPQGYPAQGAPPQGYPAQGAAPQGYPAQGAAPQGYPPQGAPPGVYPPPAQDMSGYVFFILNYYWYFFCSNLALTQWPGQGLDLWS